MTHFDYNPKDITESDLDAKIKELFNGSDFVYGDVVKLKGDVNCPAMVITGIDVKSFDVQYKKLSRCYEQAECTYFNKSSQSFLKSHFSVLCLQKITV